MSNLDEDDKIVAFEDSDDKNLSKVKKENNENENNENILKT